MDSRWYDNYSRSPRMPDFSCPCVQSAVDGEMAGQGNSRSTQFKAYPVHNFLSKDGRVWASSRTFCGSCGTPVIDTDMRPGRSRLSAVMLEWVRLGLAGGHCSVGLCIRDMAAK